MSKLSLNVPSMEIERIAGSRLICSRGGGFDGEANNN
jgi:hypothetical protein